MGQVAGDCVNISVNGLVVKNAITEVTYWKHGGRAS
jgi:hypothetical protein